MKTKIHFLVTGLALLALSTLNPQLSTAFAQATAITYQGRLNDGAGPANGRYDFRFSVYDDGTTGTCTAGPITNTAVAVSNGLFTTVMDFGDGPHSAKVIWLDLGVRTNGIVGAFVPLTPRTQLTPVPLALYATNAGLALQAQGLTPGAAAGFVSSSGGSVGGSLSVGGTVTSAETGNSAVVGADGGAGTVGEPNTGVYGVSANPAGNGVVGEADGAGGYGVWGMSTLGDGGVFTGGANGIVASGNIGGYFSGNNYGIYANSTNYAAFLVGDVRILASGTNMPMVPQLEVADGSAAGNARLRLSAGPAYWDIAHNGTNHSLTFYNSILGGNALTIQTNGTLTVPWKDGVMVYAGNAPLITATYFANFFAGQNAGNTTMDASAGNTGIGRQSLEYTTTGFQNTGLGDDALLLNTSGAENTAVGYAAMLNNTNGNYNIAIGANALYQNLSGSENIAIGEEALKTNTIGGSNVAIGNSALLDNTNGNYNLAIGLGAMTRNLNGSQNTAVGYMALSYNTNGNNNIALGYQAGYSIIGTNNIDIGNQGVATDTNVIRIGSSQTQTFIAGVINGNGAGLTNLGAASSFTVTNLTVNGVIYSGGSTLIQSYGTGNFFAGPGAGNLTMSGNYNTGVGNAALDADTTGANNTADGNGALGANTTGNDNLASGVNALTHNLSGGQNAAYGAAALYKNTSGTANTADGYEALFNNTSGSNNIALGYEAGYNLTTGSSNIDIGNLGVATDTNIIRIGSGQTSTYLAGNSVHVPGMLRLGSETNTASGPNYPSDGLVIRRVASTSQSISNLLACTDALMLTRDGTASGLAMNYSNIGSYYQNIVAIGIDRSGVQHIYRNNLTGGSGTLFIFNDSLHIVHYDVSFGNVYNGGNTCHVILDRYDDGSTSDNFMVGYLTSTYNQ
jgi:hypothetical protein